jgi:hypothetical protein
VNAHRRKEAKRARRRYRLTQETPGQREARERRKLERADEGSRRLLDEVAKLPPRHARVGQDADPFVAMPCTCDPPKRHGVHWVRKSRASEPDQLRDAA